MLGRRAWPCYYSLGLTQHVKRNNNNNNNSATSSRDEQSKLLDLLEVFRDYTEKGKVASTILASQITNLESATRKLENKAKSFKAPEKPTSYASVANSNLTSTSNSTTSTPQEWTVVKNPKATKQKSIAIAIAKPATKPIKNKLNRLILIRSNPSEFSPLALRNAFNKAFSNKGVTSQ